MSDLPDIFRLDRTTVHKVRLGEKSGDRQFWLTQPPEIRIAMIELLRQENHGEIEPGLQRISQIVKRS